MNKQEFLTRFFEGLQGIDYFVFGAYLSLPEDTGGSDIDIIVERSGVEYAMQLLRRLTQEGGGSVISYYNNAHAHFFRCLFFPACFGVQIDLFCDGLYCKGVEFYPRALMRRSVIEHRGIRVLELRKGYYVGFLKDILYLGHAKERYQRAFIDALQADADTCRRELTELYGAEMAELAFTHLSAEGLSAVARRLQRLMQRALRRGHRLAMLRARLALLQRLTGKRPGYVIVVEGTDGSGKSFVINNISPVLNEACHGGVVYRHLRPNLLPDLGVLLGKKQPNADGNTCPDPHGQPPSGLIGSVLRWGYYLLDYTLGYWFRVWPHVRTRSRIVLFDRWYYEYYLDQRRCRVRLPRWLIRAGECFLPQPDLILALVGDPTAIYARKPETSPEEVQRQVAALRQFCASRRNAVLINTTCAPEESIRRALEACYNMMHSRSRGEDSSG